SSPRTPPCWAGSCCSRPTEKDTPPSSPSRPSALVAPKDYGHAVPNVETATGPTDLSNLGRVLMHEHVFIISPEMKDNVPEDWGDDETRLADAAKRLTELKESGIDTILDPTALGLGRYIPRIAQLADRIDLKIVVATGLYTFNE